MLPASLRDQEDEDPAKRSERRYRHNHPGTAKKQKRPLLFREAAVRTSYFELRTSYLLVAAGRSPARFPHAFGHDADLFDARALGRVDDRDDLAVPQRARGDQEHRLVLALIED